MTTSYETDHITPEARDEAVAVFLRSYNQAGRAISIWEALKAVRERYPVLEISDNDLTRAIAAQAAEADLNIDFDSTDAASHSSDAAELDRGSSDPDEGGTNAPAAQAETQRSIDADTSGARRRARETKERNGLI